ncbi:MAG: hypothetical protein ACK6D5_24650 [Planctomyces sp.]
MGWHCRTVLRYRLYIRCRTLAKIPRQQAGAGADSGVVAEGLHEDRSRLLHVAGISSCFSCHSSRSQETAATLESSAAHDSTVRTPAHYRSAGAGRRNSSGLPSGTQPIGAGTHSGSVPLAEWQLENGMVRAAKQRVRQNFAPAAP